MFCYNSFPIVNTQLKMKRCLLLPFNFIKWFLGPRYKLCFSLWPFFWKNSQDYVVIISHFGQESQINHQTCCLTASRIHLCCQPKLKSFWSIIPKLCCCITNEFLKNSSSNQFWNPSAMPNKKYKNIEDCQPKLE